MSRVWALVAAVALLGCPQPPREPSPCERLVAALEERRLRCLEARPRDAIDCETVTLRQPGEVLANCLIELDAVRCDEPVPASCAGQIAEP